MRTLAFPLLSVIGLLARSIPVHLSAQSQNLSAQSQHVEFELLSPDGGLGPFVVGVVQDQQEFIWIAVGLNTWWGSLDYRRKLP